MSWLKISSEYKETPSIFGIREETYAYAVGRRTEAHRGPRICKPLRFYIILLHTGIATPIATPFENLSVDDSILNSTPVAQLRRGSASRRPVPTPGCRLSNNSARYRLRYVLHQWRYIPSVLLFLCRNNVRALHSSS
jgi:hypothetical protein